MLILTLFSGTMQRGVCGVWCVVCGVWCVMCGVWCVVCGVWCVVCGVMLCSAMLCTRVCGGLMLCLCARCVLRFVCCVLQLWVKVRTPAFLWVIGMAVTGDKDMVALGQIWAKVLQVCSLLFCVHKLFIIRAFIIRELPS